MLNWTTFLSLRCGTPATRDICKKSPGESETPSFRKERNKQRELEEARLVESFFEDRVWRPRRGNVSWRLGFPDLT
jgi:hypothetical protein